MYKQLQVSFRSIRKEHFLLLGIFLLALFLRTINLQHMPTYLHQDEVMNGYVGRYILETGKDLYGNRWPIFYFNNFGDYPTIIPMYISGISTYIFGITRFGVRFPIALIGSLVVFPLYAVCKLIFKHKNVSLFCALMIAIMPWHIVLSRATAENIMASTTFMCGLYFFLKGIEKKQLKLLAFSTLFYFITYFLYAAERVIIPLSLLPALFLTTDARMRKFIFCMIIVFFGITLAISRTPWGSARFKQTSVFTFNNQVNNQALHYTLSANQSFYLTTRIFNNKVVLYGREIIKQYLSYFSPTVLFMEGGHPDRYLVPDEGLLYITLLLILVGSLFFPMPKDLGNKMNQSFFLYAVLITLLSPLPSALTLDEVPNVHRAALLAVTIVFIVGYACLRLIRVRFGKIRIFYLVFPLLLLETCYFLHQYFAQAPYAEQYARYDARSVLIQQLIPQEKLYDTIIVPREIFPIYYLFYKKNFDPTLAGKFQLNLFVSQLGKFHFIDDDCPTTQANLPIQGKTLIVDMARCTTQPGFIFMNMIWNRDGTSAYKLEYPSPKPTPVLTKKLH